MKKNRLLFFMLSFLCLFFCLSCIDKDYDTGDLNKTYVIGNNGFIFPVGSFKEYILDENEPIDSSTESITYSQEEDVLSEDFFNYFTYEFAGDEKPIGTIRLEGLIKAYFKNPTELPRLTVEAYIKNPNGWDASDDWELIKDDPGFENVSAAELMSGREIVIEVPENEIVKIKESRATTLYFKFILTNIQDSEITPEDFIQVNDIKIISTGGILFEP